MSLEGWGRLGAAVALLVGAFVAASWLRARGARHAPFLLRRLAGSVIVLFAIFTVSFALMRSVPGGPFDAERELPAEVEAAFAERYRLDEPLLSQYATSLEGLLRGDLGPSMRLHQWRVGEIIATGFPATAVLGIWALALALVTGTLVGMFAALRRGTPLDRGLMLAATTGMALPNFVLAGLLIVPLSHRWGLLPPAGWGSPRDLVLPVICLASPFAAQIARLARTSFLEVLQSEWVRTARAKGVHEARVLFGHALTGAAPSLVTFTAPAAAGVLTGSLVIEELFAIPGIGSHFVRAALNRDYPLAMGMILLYTALLSLLNLLADWALMLLDPRVEA